MNGNGIVKKASSVFISIAMALSLSAAAQADLTIVGTDSLGNQLIYDSGLNVTWYDYTNRGRHGYGDTWQNQMNWAKNLTVNFNGQQISGWGLPSTLDGWGWGYNGKSACGYNITSSQLGYLFSVELGNRGYSDTSGRAQPVYGLTNTGKFKNLLSYGYWSATDYSIHADYNYKWYFAFSTGVQDIETQNAAAYALAVHPGNLDPTPIPASLPLFGSGLAVLGVLLRRRLKSH